MICLNSLPYSSVSVETYCSLVLKSRTYLPLVLKELWLVVLIGCGITAELIYKGTLKTMSPEPSVCRMGCYNCQWRTLSSVLFLVALLQRVAELEKVNAEFLRTKQQLEQEFNQKRAKFKELYLAKEGKFSIIWIILMCNETLAVNNPLVKTNFCYASYCSSFVCAHCLLSVSQFAGG